VSEVPAPKEIMKTGGIGIVISFFLFAMEEPGLGGMCCMASIFALFTGIVQHTNLMTNSQTEVQYNQPEVGGMDPITGLTWAEDEHGNWGWLEDLEAKVIDAGANETPEQINIPPEVISALQKNSGNLDSLSTNELKSLTTSLGMKTSNRASMVNNIRDSEAATKILKVALATVATGGAITAAGVAIATKKELAKKALGDVSERIDGIDDIDNWLKSSGIDANEIIGLIDPNGNGVVEVSEFAAFTKAHTGTILPNWMVRQIFDVIEPGNKGTISIVAMLSHLQSIGIDIGTLEVIDEEMPEEIVESEDDSDQFRVGDRLEAVVMNHPDTVAVASITAIDGDKLTIHFDGWNIKHDYITTADDLDLRPIGTQEALGEELHPPYLYEGKFDWSKYLAEIGARAAPETAFAVDNDSEEPDLEEIEPEAEVEPEPEVEEEETEIDREDDDDDDDSDSRIDSELERLIEELQVTKLRGERERLIAKQKSTFKAHLKIISIERTLIAEDDYRGGQTAMALLDDGPFTAQFLFKTEDSENISATGENSDVTVLCELVDYRSAIKIVQLSVREIIE